MVITVEVVSLNHIWIILAILLFIIMAMLMTSIFCYSVNAFCCYINIAITPFYRVLDSFHSLLWWFILFLDRDNYTCELLSCKLSSVLVIFQSQVAIQVLDNLVNSLLKMIISILQFFSAVSVYLCHLLCWSTSLRKIFLTLVWR